MRNSFFAALVAVFLVSIVAAHADAAVPTGPLPRNVVPSRVGLELKIDPALARFSGRVRIDVNITEPTRVVWMHGKGLDIARASIQSKQGRSLALEAAQVDASGVLKLTAPEALAAGEAIIEIEYSAPFGQLQGAYRVKADGSDYALTQMEALGARETFPGFDEPSFKQPWDIVLVVPANQQAVANTRLIREETAGEGWKKRVFASTENLPSYLIAFAVGPWDIVEGPDLPPTAVRETPIKLRGITVKGQGGRMKYALASTAALLEAQEEYFGIPYPFDKLDLLAAPDFGAGAMENPGLIVYRDSVLFVDENSSVRQRQSFWGTHSHELAHQWFGDLVTMRWWDDVWLNEAFATWFGNKIVGRLQPDFHTDRSMMESALWAMGQDSLASTRRVREPIGDFTEIEAAFDGITYSKGGALLAMFERYVGESEFREAIRGYLRRHARGNATSVDLIESIATVSADPGRVREAFASFLDQPGVPIVRIGAECASDKPALLVEQQRYLPAGTQASTAGQWTLPLCVRYGDSRGTHEQCRVVRGKSETIELGTSECPAWVMPNADGAGYYRFAMSAADQGRLEANFDKLNEREQRFFADSIDAAYDAGAIDSYAFLSAAARLAQASGRQTATAPLGTIDWMVIHLAEREDDRRALRAYVAKIYGPRLAKLGTVPKDGESDDDRLLRNSLLILMAEDIVKEPVLRAELAAKGRAVLGLDGSGALNLDAVAVDQRGLALRMAMEEGDSKVFQALLGQLSRSQDAVLRSQLLSALASAKDPALVARARALALEQDTLRRNEMYFVLIGRRDDPASLKAAREFLDLNYDALAGKLASEGAALINVYAYGMCSGEEAAELRTKFAQRVVGLESGPRRLAQAAESVELCAALRYKQTEAGLRIPR